MPTFFGDSQPVNTVTHGQATFDLPILYYRDDAFALYFTADYEKVKAAMPSDRLHPVIMTGNNAIAAIASARPAPTAAPLTPATTGLSQRFRRASKNRPTQAMSSSCVSWGDRGPASG